MNRKVYPPASPEAVAFVEHIREQAQPIETLRRINPRADRWLIELKKDRRAIGYYKAGQMVWREAWSEIISHHALYRTNCKRFKCLWWAITTDEIIQQMMLISASQIDNYNPDVAKPSTFLLNVARCQIGEWISTQIQPFKYPRRYHQSRERELIPVLISRRIGNDRDDEVDLPESRDDRHVPARTDSEQFWDEVKRMLPECEWRIVSRHLIGNMTYPEVAAELGVTRQRVEQIYKRALLRIEREFNRLGRAPTLKDFADWCSRV